MLQISLGKISPLPRKRFLASVYLERANQYNIKHNEFKPSVPPRDPKPYPQSIQKEKQKDFKKKPLVGKDEKVTSSRLLQEYLQPDSTKEVSNRDVIQSNAMATKYLDDHDKSEHPISLLASLEYKITPSEDVTELNANIVAIDTSEEMHMNQGQIPLEEDPISKETNHHLFHEAHINSVTKYSNGLDPFYYEMFNPKINFVSELQSDEESIIVQSDDSNYDDAMSNFDEVKGEESMNALSNTEEMYLLFEDEHNNEKSISNLEGQHEDDIEVYHLDPFLASGEAHMPDDIIDLVNSDSEEEDRHEQDRIPSNAKAGTLSHPMDVLLEIDAKEYAKDDERLLKLMSLAIQNGAPSNLVNLYLNGHSQKSHVINYIKTSANYD